VYTRLSDGVPPFLLRTPSHLDCERWIPPLNHEPRPKPFHPFLYTEPVVPSWNCGRPHRQFGDDPLPQAPYRLPATTDLPNRSIWYEHSNILRTWSWSLTLPVQIHSPKRCWRVRLPPARRLSTRPWSSTIPRTSSSLSTPAPSPFDGLSSGKRTSSFFCLPIGQRCPPDPPQTRIRMETRRMLHHSKAGPTRSRCGDKRTTRTDSDGVGPDPGLQPQSVRLLSPAFHIAVPLSPRRVWGRVHALV